MKRWVCLALLAALLCLALSVPACADGSKKSGLFSYTIKGNGTAVITGFDWDANGNNDIYIPNMVDGYTVTEIGEKAFTDEREKYYRRYDVKVKIALIMPSTITVIGDKAFMSAWDIASMTIPSSVQIIGAGAFADTLCSFHVDSSNPVFTTIDGILYDKQKKALIACPDEKLATGYWEKLIIPEGIQEIAPYAFFNHGSLHIDLPSTVSTIGDFAFATQRNEHIGINSEYQHDESVLGSSIKRLGIGAFMGNIFETVDMSHTQLTEIPDYCFSGCSIADELDLPPNISRIGKFAFGGNLGLLFDNSFNFHNIESTLEEIGLQSGTKFGMQGERSIGTKLKEVSIPASVTIIDDYAFADSELNSYSNVEITFAVNSKLTTIGDGAFCLMDMGGNQEIITIPQGVKQMGDDVFAGVEGLIKLSLPSSLERIGENLCTRTSVTIEAEPGSYAAVYAAENGYTLDDGQGDDTSWLNE